MSTPQVPNFACHRILTYLQAYLPTKPTAARAIKGTKKAVDKLPDGLRNDPEAMAEAIENNVRKLIIDESPVNPKYFEKMSELLEALIKERKQQALHYTAYLEKIAALARKVQKPESTASYPQTISTGHFGHSMTIWTRIENSRSGSIVQSGR